MTSAFVVTLREAYDQLPERRARWAAIVRWCQAGALAYELDWTIR